MMPAALAGPMAQDPGPEFQRLRSRHAQLDGPALLYALIGPTGPLHRRTALVSAFGAESVVLLHMAAADRPGPAGDLPRHRPALPRDPGLPRPLVDRSGLTDIRTAYPDAAALRRHDRHGRLFARRPRPLLRHPQDRAAGRGAGRASPPGSPAASASRAACAGRSRRSSSKAAPAGSSSTRWPPGTRTGSRPTASGTTCRRIRCSRRGYRSIGCASCTRPTARDGEDARAGRWFGIDKTECGIHLPAPYGDNI